ncbi:hypothetical protein [Brevundimonas sp. SORGH_AS_0993]|uniref:hypothetical protein n=1 Tax=Brevundimonas sp. SORGH_AS_0993 TaxID=3041794 RepID=UPI002785C593|nr:hypothetical protein [Brevundimonas sp. SORGH_AS_0993]MDQ1153094.1 hypothetical protein [Brevundimonas sp. SORGH_AS_0993]
MIGSGDNQPRISQNLTARLVDNVILPGLAALPTHQGLVLSGAASQEEFLDRAAKHFDNVTAAEARRGFALVLAATFERHLRRWLFLAGTPSAGSMKFADLLEAGLARLTDARRTPEMKATLDELVLVGNVLRHGNGRSVTALRAAAPDLWHDIPEEDHHWLERTYTYAELMRVEMGHIRRYSNAILLFWGLADRLPGAALDERY